MTGSQCDATGAMGSLNRVRKEVEGSIRGKEGRREREKGSGRRKEMK